jgi:KUP system potassium uptake protein
MQDPVAVEGRAVPVEGQPSHRISQQTTPATALLALGIVYGDLGTSPLYTLQAIVQTMGNEFTPSAALGSLSLIFWALVIVISIKYCIFVMRADNHGEGGILALMAMTGARWSGRGRSLVIFGLFGAALIYGDGIITPAISVLSAVEGLNVATDFFKPHIMPIAVVILVMLFVVQSRGTARIGNAFGPIMLVWFLTIGALGAVGIVHHPEVLAAVNPEYAIKLLIDYGFLGFAVLGGVFLAVTGGEALYADMGHIGRNPIRMAWYCLVLPALLLNYAGQVGIFLENPNLAGSAFFKLAPALLIYPLVGLATLATVIASQAIITGAFSMTRQAMQLGWFPGVHIRQTSAEEYGQIYVPFVNWTMMLFTVALTIGFASSDRLAGAYGTAVSTTMLLTTILLYTVMRRRWQWTAIQAGGTVGVFVIVDITFFSANLLKIQDGGWIPLTFGAVVFIVMTTWHLGIVALHNRNALASETPEQFFKRLTDSKVARVRGTAIFLTRLAKDMPPLIVKYVEQTGSAHESLIALTIDFEDVPRVSSKDRVDVRQLQKGFWHITIRFGFVEIPDLPSALNLAKNFGCPLDVRNAVYFVERDEVIIQNRWGVLDRCRIRIFSFMFRNSVHATDLFNIPPQRLMEIGRRIGVASKN